MKYSFGLKYLFLLLFFVYSSKTAAQCFEIESILVDACSSSSTISDEGLNEMVRFKVGATAINTSNLNVVWPNAGNLWQGLLQNAFTASKVATLNADITALGGCGQLLEPIGGVLPANAKVILITSFNFSITANAFGALTNDIYILFQNNAANVSGNFANYGTTGTLLRTLTISFGACTDVVTYDKSLLIDSNGNPAAADGATVTFTPAGVASYSNSGCVAPIDVFMVDAGNPISACPGDTISLIGTAQGQSSVAWTAPIGTFSAANALATNFIIPFSASGTIVLTLTATNTANSCGGAIFKTDTVIVTVNAASSPNFAPTISLCSGSVAPVLNTTSPNGIIGTWSPTTISNTASNSYVFTPNAGQCATNFITAVTITPATTPNFSATLSLCSGSVAPVLNTTSPNGIVGTWSPTTISNTASNSYVFTPNAGQCATNFTTVVTVTSASITPNFPATLSLCSGSVAPVLNTTSPNGIVGTWSPGTISNSAGNSYVFTPNAGQCATNFTTVVTITPATTPNFSAILTLCSGSVAPVLNTTSPNGIVGTWSPTTISNTASNSYVFTPNAGQCATNFTTVVTITLASITPNFPATLSLCSGSVAPVLNTTSPNGIVGTWSPTTISNTASNSYVFTPNAGQCATNFTTVVTITPASITPNFSATLSLCTGSVAPVLNTTSPNGIVGTWSPATISNSASNSYVFTPNAGQCATNFTTVVTVTSASITPNFSATLSLCSGSVAPVLNTTSPNGIVGTWSPTTISNSASNSYVFTPNAGQCATNVTTVVTVTSASITPNFPATLSLCSGSVAPVLNTTSPNGIVGTWSPTTISNSASNSYVFTPNAGQCATNFTTVVTVTSASITPNFSATLSLCSGSVAPVLNTTSPNGIVGTWSPATISNTASNSYVFTPNAGQCAKTVTTLVSVTPPSIIPTFNTFNAICSGDLLAPLPMTSNNGIVGTWSPTLNNLATTAYTFTPNLGQCAQTISRTIVVNPKITPDFPTVLSFCNGTVAPNLNSTSPNGIVGTWSPTTISTVANGIYFFTPNSNQCANPMVLNVTITDNTILNDHYYICLDGLGNASTTAYIDTHLSPVDYIFSWTKDGNVVSNSVNFYEVSAPGTYTVVATNQITGCTITTIATVEESPKAEAFISVGNDFDDVQQIIVTVHGGLGNYEYQLNNGLFQQSNSFFITEGGDYTVHVKDDSGCNNFVLEISALNYPKFFTPNNDGYNDTWNIGGLTNFHDAVISIFDRYGKLVKQISPNGLGWDGIYNGKPLPSTDYWFKLFYIDNAQISKTFKGHFALKR